MRLLLLAILLMSVSAYATGISSCQTLSASDTYTLTQDVSQVLGDCFDITTDNIVLDVFLTSGSPPGNVTINITKNYTWGEFQTFSQQFFIDWTPIALAILSYAFAWLFSRKLPETLIMGGIGLFICFLLTFNFVFIACSVFSMVLGLAMKQAVG